MNTWIGRKHTDETRAKMSAARKGRKFGKYSDEHRAAISVGKKGKPQPKRSEEHKSAISRSMKGIVRSDEYREKMSRANKGKKRTEECNRRNSERMKARFERAAGGLVNPNLPNGLERRFIQLIEKENLPFRYVGDGKLWINRMNPDFVHTDRERRVVVELYGDFWHRGEDVQVRIDRFARHGWQCMIIWETDVLSILKDAGL